MKINKQWGSVFAVLMLSGFVFGVMTFAVSGQEGNPATTVMVSEPSVPAVSIAVRDIKPSAPEHLLNREEINPIRNPGLFMPGLGLPGSNTTNQDPLVALSQLHTGYTPSPIFTFEGLGTDGYTPPDTMGEVGPNHYVQMVNVSFAIYDKSGVVVVADTAFTDLFTGSGLTFCSSQNDGDPVVLWDSMADRWLLSQFAVSTTPEHMCVAISQTADPAGAYYLYEFEMPDFPDYFKFGVWPDAYYMGTNTGYPNQYYAYAFDRDAMLAGLPATYQYSNGHPNFLLPADLDGTTQPPAGSPGYFYTMLAQGYPDHPAGVDRLALYEFDVDWTTPGNSTFTLAQEIPIADYNYTTCGFFAGNCIPQPDVAQKLDAVDSWPMWRFAYRNLGPYEAMVGNFTVDTNGADHAGIRWFELQKTGATWDLHQEGTHSPDSDHRWMGSIAMDGSGNIALGYSVSSTTTYPSLRYASRLRNDPLGTLQTESTLYAGGGSQTGPYDRWGDYSSMSIDPADECTFWYTGEYHDVSDVSFNWNTRIGTFRLPECTGALGDTGTLAGQVTDAYTSNGISGALVSVSNPTTTVGTTTDVMGYYTRTLAVSTYDITASAYGYQPITMSNVDVFSGTTTTVDFSLTPEDLHTVDGTVTDGTTHWPLYAHVSISGDPINPPVTGLWTDPATGYYSVTLAEGITYTFNVEAWVPGYLPESVAVGPLSGDLTVDVALDADLIACQAPGYSAGTALDEQFDTWPLPVGWTIVNNGGDCEWQAGSSDGDSNNTGGTGNYADADSDACGIGTSMDTELWTPVLDLGAFSTAEIEFKSDMYWYSSDLYDVDLSLDGGTTWPTNLLHRDGASYRGPETINLALTGAAGDNDVRLRFRYQGNWDFWWQVDDVIVFDPTVSCTPDPGGLVVGNVYDDNTLNALNGAMVENEAGFVVEAVETPLDDAVDDGFYTLFSPVGSQVFTATMVGGYGPDVDSVNVVMGHTVSHNFYVPAPSISVAPTSLEITLAEGYSATLPLELINAGAFSTPFELVEVASSGSMAAPVSVLVNEYRANTNAKSNPDGFTPRLDWKMTTLVPFGTTATVDILIVTPDSTGGDISPLLAVLATYPDLNVTVWDNTAGSPTSTDMAPYDVVMIGNDLTWESQSLDKAAIGNAVADYIDAGGKVIESLYVQSFDAWGFSGRYMTDGYSPFTVASLDSWTADTMSIIEPSHPVMAGVTSVADNWGHQNPGLAVGATSLATWTNSGYQAVAANENVVALNQLIFASADWTGDVGLILHNAAQWLAGGQAEIPWLSEDPITGTLPADSTYVIDVTFDTMTYTVGTYAAGLKVNTDDPLNGSIIVPVTMTIEAPSYGVALTPATDGQSGEPGAIITYTLNLENTGNVPDTFALTDSGGSWDVTISESSITLDAGESVDFTVVVIIPGNASNGATDVVTITASGSGSAMDSSLLTTEAVVTEYQLFLSIIYK